MAEETQNKDAAPKTLVNTERRVQVAFMAIGLALILILRRAVAGIGEVIANRFDTAQIPDKLVDPIAVIIGIVIAVALYRNKSINKFSQEVVAELGRVKWPTREETWSNTIVVIITSLISAVIIFFFDSMWSAITDLIYKV